MRKLLLIGGGGHCKSVIDSVMSEASYDAVGVVDFENTSIADFPVVGTDNDLPQLYSNGWSNAFITVGSIGNTTTRRRLYNLVKQLGFIIPTIIDQTAIVASNATIAEGCYIGKRAVVNTGSSLGCCAIINSGAIVEHECKIGAFSHISPGAILCGQVTVGDDSHIGAGTTIRQQIVIGNNALVGCGSTVIKDIPDDVIAYGNPCRVVEVR